MIKICFCTTVSSTLDSFIIRFVKYLHENTDWEISLMCSGDDNFQRRLPEYVRFFPIDMKRGISLNGFSAIRQMKRIFKREKFDLVQYSTPNASLYASIAAKKAKIPVRLYCQWGMVFVAFSGLKRKIFKLEEKFVCSNSTWIEPDSNSNLVFARKEGLYGSNKSSVVWNGSACGIDLEKFNIKSRDEFREKIRKQYGIASDATVFIFVGRITRDKGINELLNAYFKLSETKQSYMFLLGRNESSDVDEVLYKKSLSFDKIIYTGNVTNVEEYLAASDCFVMPSYREGFGMGVIEAEAMGLPVIVTDIPGPTDGMIDEETGLIVSKKDEEALYHAMNRIYDNPELGRQFGKKGLKFVEDNFEQSLFMKKLLNDRKRLTKA